MCFYLRSGAGINNHFGELTDAVNLMFSGATTITNLKLSRPGRVMINNESARRQNDEGSPTAGIVQLKNKQKLISFVRNNSPGPY